MASYCEVPLTSAENPIQVMARIAALHMLDLINGKEVPHSTELEGGIVVRESVAPFIPAGNEPRVAVHTHGVHSNSNGALTMP